MTIDEIKRKLDTEGIDYSQAKNKQDYLALLPDEKTSLVDKFDALVEAPKEAKQQEQTDNRASILRNKEPGTLTRSQKLYRNRDAEEYESVQDGIEVKIASDYLGNKVIEKVAGGILKQFKAEKTYVMSMEDYDVVKAKTLRVKTPDTKNKCCGQAKYMNVPMLEVI